MKSKNSNSPDYLTETLLGTFSLQLSARAPKG